MRAMSSASVKSATVSATRVIHYCSWGPTPLARARRRGFAALLSDVSRGPQARSLRVIDRAGFANDRYFDLAGIFELVLDSPGDVLREPDGFFVRDLLALDHDTDFTA